MKKILALVMVIVLCLSLCACGGKKTIATVKWSDGRSEEMDAKTLIKQYEENAARFSNCSVVVEAVIEKISTDSVPTGNGSNQAAYVLNLEGNWEVKILQSVYDKSYSHLNVGDKVRVTSGLNSASSAFGVVYLSKIHTNGTGAWQDDTTVTVVK